MLALRNALTGFYNHHLLKAFHWSTETEVNAFEIIAASLGMAVPVYAASVWHHRQIGMAALLGGLAVSSVPVGRNASEHGVELLWQLSVFLLAAAFGVLLAMMPDMPAIVIFLILAGTTAVLGGYSRNLARTSIRFVISLVFVFSAAKPENHPLGILFFSMAGAVWTALLMFLFAWAFRKLSQTEAVAAGETPSQPTARQRWARWKRSLGEFSGWQYPLRLVSSLMAAEGIKCSFPAHRFNWIILTVCILTSRQLEVFPIKATQRILGTTLGVAVAGAISGFRWASLELALMVGLIAGLRRFFQSRNYFAYSLLMTLLVFCALGSEKMAGGQLLADRLMATLIAAGLVILANLAAEKAIWALGNPP
jgi:hypothetical protein